MNHTSLPLILTRAGLFLLALTPLIYSERFIFFYMFTKDVFVIALVALMLASFCWLLIKEPARWKGVGLVGGLLWGYVGVLTLTGFTGVDPIVSFWSGMDRNVGVFMWAMIAMLYTIARHVFEKKHWQYWFASTVSVALLVSGIHLMSEIGIELVPASGGGSTLGNSSFLGTYLLFHLFFALLIAADPLTRSWKLFGLVAFVLMGFTLLTTSAHAAMVSAAGGLVFLVALVLASKPDKHKRTMGWGLIALLVIGFFTASVLIFQEGNRLNEEFVSLASESRFTVWGIALEGIKERPLLGWGTENFEVVFLKHFDPCFGSIACEQGLWFDRAHNKVLDVLIDSGLVGFISYVSIFVGALWVLLKRVRQESEFTLEAAVVVALLAAYVVQNLTVFDTSVSLLFFVMLLAFFQPTKNTVSPIPNVIPIGGLLLTPIMFFVLVLQPMSANAAIVKHAHATTLVERLEYMERAMTVSAVERDFRRSYLALDTAVFLWNNHAAAEQIKEHALNETQLVEEQLLDSISRSPNYLRGMVNLALIYQTEGRFYHPERFDDAVMILETAMESNPNNPLPFWAMASVQIDLGNVERAYELTQEVLERDPMVDEAHTYRLIALRFLGDSERFEQAYKESSELFPNLVPTFDLYAQASMETERDPMIFQYYMTN